MRSLVVLLAAGFLVSCSGNGGPETLVKGKDTCAHCRMPISDLHFAAQIIAPGELTLFFDDPGCLGQFVVSGQVKGEGATAWVADHRTGAWIRADLAVYTRVPDLRTPMNHNLVAHESVASRAADPEVRGGHAVDLEQIFGPKGPPVGVER